MHDRHKFYLVFDPDNEVVYKTSKEEDASNFIHTALRAKEGH